MALKDLLGKAKEEVRTRVQEARHKAGEKKEAKKVAKAKKKVGKTWTKAVKKQKKKGEKGVSLSSLVSKRKGLKKGTAEYNKVQNQINKAYGVKKRHGTEKPKSKKRAGVKTPVHSAKKQQAGGYKPLPPKSKKASPKKPEIGQSYETAEASKPTPSGPESPVGKKEYEAKPGQESTMQRNKPKYAEGGEVEGGGMFNWPSRDARNGGNK